MATQQPNDLLLLSNKLDIWEEKIPCAITVFQRLKGHANSRRFNDHQEAFAAVRTLASTVVGKKAGFRDAVCTLTAFTTGNKNLSLAMRSLDVFGIVMQELDACQDHPVRTDFLWLLTNLAVDFPELRSARLMELLRNHVLSANSSNIQDSMIWSLVATLDDRSPRDPTQLVAIVSTIVELLGRATLKPKFICECTMVVGVALENGGQEILAKEKPELLTALWAAMSKQRCGATAY